MSILCTSIKAEDTGEQHSQLIGIIEGEIPLRDLRKLVADWGVRLGGERDACNDLVNNKWLLAAVVLAMVHLEETVEPERVRSRVVARVRQLLLERFRSKVAVYDRDILRVIDEEAEAIVSGSELAEKALRGEMVGGMMQDLVNDRITHVTRRIRRALIAKLQKKIGEIRAAEGRTNRE